MSEIGIAPTRGGRITDCTGALLRARGLPLPIGGLARIGDVLIAEAVGFAGDELLLAPFAPPQGLVTGARVVVRPDEPVAIAYGRAVDALGAPLDGRGQVVGRRIEHCGSLPPAARGAVTEPLATGVRAIDALLTLGRGQRIAVAAAAGVGKTTLLQSLLRHADVDAVIVALIGERGREIADFTAVALGAAGAERTMIVAATSDQAPALRLRAADRATRIAEALRAEGKSVLLLFDSMTRVAQAQREIGLALGEAAAMGAYPPSAFALIPRLVERAGVDRRSGGSITALYTVLAEAGDADDPVVDALRAATDGHIVLSRSLAERGIYPAIDLAASLSRTMPAVVGVEQLADAARARRLWVLAEEMRELMLMGAYTPGTDAEADEALSLRDALHRFVTQGDDRIDAMTAVRQLAGLVV